MSASQFHVYLLWGQRPFSVLNVKGVVAAFNQEKALVGAFTVITNLRMELFQALMRSVHWILASGAAGLRLYNYI